MNTVRSVALVAAMLGGLAMSGVVSKSENSNLVANSNFETRNANSPAGFSLDGAAEYRYLGDQRRDMSSNGIALWSNKPAGEVSCVVKDIGTTSGPAHENWFRFTFRGLPQGNFAVRDDDLYMKVSFYGQSGKVGYDNKSRKIYDLIENARKDLGVNGWRGRGGAEVWTTYTLDFCLPFPQVDQLKLTVGFDHGSAKSAQDSAFFVDDMSLTRIATPAGVHPATQPAALVPQGKLIPIGGRWFYAAKEGETKAPHRFDYKNADRLLYHDAVYSAPFANNMTATMKSGYMDLSGNVLTKPKLVEDNVVVTFDSDTMIIHSHNIPNHPTGQFPEQGFGNPSYVGEQNETFYFPLYPTQDKGPTATDKTNTNRALHMGPIGIAINGVVFFNPFDMGNQVAVDLMDRCCGHPNQDNLYHYHKYPICVNTPWADEGDGHSPLIGWAFDGYPVYGPFEKANVMARDVKGAGALNAFNIHYDEDRGWHYHVTPGQFPYLIGGFWGVEDERNSFRGRRGLNRDARQQRQGGQGPMGQGPNGQGPQGDQQDGQFRGPPDGGTMGMDGNRPPPPGGRPPRRR